MFFIVCVCLFQGCRVVQTSSESSSTEDTGSSLYMLESSSNNIKMVRNLEPNWHERVESNWYEIDFTQIQQDDFPYAKTGKN